jgi:hypothetical protein
MLTGFAEARMLIEGKDTEMRERWEMARWMIFMIVSGNPYIRPGHRPHRPSDLLRFPWDGAMEVKERRPVTAEQKEGLNEIMRMFYNKNN